MKRSCIVVTVVLLLTMTTTVWAHTTMTLHPLGHLFGVTALEYETALEEELGAGMTLAVQAVFGEPDVADTTLWLKGVGVGVRYYKEGQVHQGLYFGGYASLTSLRGEYDGRNVQGNAFGVHTIGGNKWHLADGLVVDAGIGLGFPVSGKGDLSENDLSAIFNMRIGLGIGVTF